MFQVYVLLHILGTQILIWYLSHNHLVECLSCLAEHGKDTSALCIGSH